MQAQDRLFSIFDVPDNSDASRELLLAMLNEDMLRWGYDELFARTYSRNALRLVGGEGPTTVRDLSEQASGNLEALAEAAEIAADGVTVADLQWYWCLSRTSRSAMEAFDSVIFWHMYLDRHPFNLCVEDLQQDVRQRLPDLLRGERGPLSLSQFAID
jgi:hypothetical protein